MRIISGHDYYDSAVAFGIDPSIVFVRQKDNRLEKNSEMLPRMRTFVQDLRDQNGKSYNKGGKKIQLILQPLCVYLCGVRYNGIQLIEKVNYFPDLCYYFWEYSDLVECLEKRYGAFLGEERFYSREDTPKTFFSKQTSSAEFDACITNKIVIATWVPGVEPYWRINGDNLKDFQFYRKMDPFKCYQEIAMYVGGVLPRTGNEMVEISDKSKIQKHGMDKWSFRKMGKNSK